MKTNCRLGTAVARRLVFCLYLANSVATLLHQTSPVSVLVIVFVSENEYHILLYSRSNERDYVLGLSVEFNFATSLLFFFLIFLSLLSFLSFSIATVSGVVGEKGGGKVGDSTFGEHAILLP